MEQSTAARERKDGRSTRKRATPDSAHPRRSSREEQLLHLQRTVGNRATTSLVIQRLTVKVQLQGQTISSVSFPDTSGVHKGDHTTPYTSFLSMVRNQLMGQPWTNARAILLDLVKNIRGLPGMQKASADYLMTDIDTQLADEINAISDPQSLERVLERIVALRNKIPLSAFKHTHSTGGHGEAYNDALLNECEDRVRNNQKLRYDVDQIRSSAWELLDYRPTDGESDAQIAVVLAQHVYSLQLSYPRLWQYLTDQNAYLYPYFESKYAKTTFSKLQDQMRVPAIMGMLKAGIMHGPSALPEVGKSGKY